MGIWIWEYQYEDINMGILIWGYQYGNINMINKWIDL